MTVKCYKYSYDGYRITTVLEDADAVTQNGSMDYPGKNREMAFEYNEWGALVKDESRGIKDISYDNFGNPVRIDFADGSYTENVYSATFRTYPDELCYDKDFRHMIIKENRIIITDFLDHPFFSISMDKLKEGVLSIDDYGHDLLHKYDDEIKQIEW